MSSFCSEGLGCVPELGYPKWDGYLEKDMKIAIIGRTQLLYETALKLHDAGHEIRCVITAKASPEYTRNEKDFQHLAEKMGAPFFLSNSLVKLPR